MLSGQKTCFLLPREVVPRRVAMDVLHCGGFISIATAAFTVTELSSLVQKLLTTSVLDFFCYFLSNICPDFWKPWFPETGFPWFSAQCSSCTAAFLCSFQSRAMAYDYLCMSCDVKMPSVSTVVLQNMPLSTHSISIAPQRGSSGGCRRHLIDSHLKLIY